MNVLRNCFSRHALLLLACALFLLTCNASAEAQLLSRLRTFQNGGPETAIRHSPESPRTQGRWFQLQTGHAGAFYNCDGEEDKRYSPHITWQTTKGVRWYSTLSDVVRWKQDRDEIAQRICDGAGACCEQEPSSPSNHCTTCEHGGAIIAATKPQHPSATIAKVNDKQIEASQMRFPAHVAAHPAAKPRDDDRSGDNATAKSRPGSLLGWIRGAIKR